jgi:hypothetical protein
MQATEEANRREGRGLPELRSMQSRRERERERESAREGEEICRRPEEKFQRERERGGLRWRGNEI